MSRLLILSAAYGEGHNSAARGLLHAARERPGVEADLLDVFSLHLPKFDRWSRKAYLRLINGAPGVWKHAYRWIDRSTHTARLFRMLADQRRLLAREIAARRPDALLCTYPVYPWMLADLRRAGVAVPPVYTVITDALTINSIWHRAPSNGWFVTDPGSADCLVQAGVPIERIRVSGFPVALAFADRLPDQHPADPSRTRRPRLLHIINSGRQDVLETARRLVALPGVEITFTIGHHRQLRRQLEQRVRDSPARTEILGWTDRIPELLMTHHLVISKAGGATTQEAINAMCPMLVNQVVPGQEEGNWELLRRHGVGALATTPAEIAAAVQQAFADDAALWKSWRSKLRLLARPNAARAIIGEVLRASRQLNPERQSPLAVPAAQS